jgi:PIN domain nuclease of toxin-antitoxin system
MSRSASSNDADLPLLLDTHVLVWLVLGEPMLGSRTKSTIARASLEGRILISAITPWEIGVLVSKGRIDLRRDALAWVRSALELPGVRFAELSPEISVGSTRLPWEMHGDPADRILVATARHLGAVLVTADRKLLADAGKKHFHAMNARA